MALFDELIEQYYSKNEYKRKYRDYTIFVDYEKVNNLYCNPAVTYNLVKLILNPQYKSKLDNFIKNNFPYLTIIGLIEVDNSVHECAQVVFYKKELLKKINEALSKNAITLNQEEQNAYDKLIKSCNLDKLLIDYKDQKFTCTIANQEYKIPIDSFFTDLLLLPDQEYEDYFKNNQAINTIPIQYFVYIINTFFGKEHILNKYYLPKIEKRFNEIRTYQKIDFQSINRICTSDFDYLEDIDVNEKLKDAVLKDINPNFNPLEKAIFIYIRLCKILEYDEQYAIYHNKTYGQISKVEHHFKKDYIKNITPQNNNSICWEFNGIFAYFLHYILNLLFKIEYFELPEYGKGHNYVIFIWDKYIIEADSTHSFDMQLARLNHDLEGLTCVNESKETQEEFEKYLQNVYNYIISLEKENNTLPIDYIFGTTSFKENYDMIISEYQKKYEIKNITLKERLYIFLEKMTSSGLSRIDSLQYGMYIKTILFTEFEIRNNISFNIFKHQEKKDDEVIATACAIVAFNEYDIQSLNNSYYLIKDNEYYLLTREEINKYFDNNNLGYITNIKVPGLKK